MRGFWVYEFYRFVRSTINEIEIIKKKNKGKKRVFTSWYRNLICKIKIIYGSVGFF